MAHIFYPENYDKKQAKPAENNAYAAIGAKRTNIAYANRCRQTKTTPT